MNNGTVSNAKFCGIYISTHNIRPKDFPDRSVLMVVGESKISLLIIHTDGRIESNGVVIGTNFEAAKAITQALFPTLLGEIQ